MLQYTTCILIFGQFLSAKDYMVIDKYIVVGGMPMRIAVCDDCVEDALYLRNILRGQEVSVYSDAESLLADVQEKNRWYDLYLLDIFMEESMDGIELAKRLRMEQEEAMICFVSTSDDFYREAYDLYAIQYLLKPVREESVEELLQKVQKNLARRLHDKEKTLIYSWWGKRGAIPYEKIRYIRIRGHTLSICCTDGRVQESTGKLNDLERQICGDAFLRCHQSFIVNMNHVRAFSGTELTLAKDGQKVPVSRRYRTEVKTRFEELLFEGVE